MGEKQYLNVDFIKWIISTYEIDGYEGNLYLLSDNIEISFNLTKFPYGTVDFNKLVVNDNISILGSMTDQNNIDINSISKVLQTNYYSPNNINNYYIKYSNLNTTISYELLNDFSINIIPVKISSKFRIITNLNYLTSNYNDTKLNLKLYYIELVME